MRGISHIIIGSSITFAAFQQLHINYGASALAASLVGSVLADIDEDDSIINSFMPMHYKKMVYALVSVLLFYHIYQTRDFKLLMPALVTFMIYISGHRGFTHSIIAMSIFSAPLASNQSLFYAFQISYGAHLLCDLVNTKGLQLFWPLAGRYNFPVHFTMKSMMGKTLEAVAVVISVSAALKNWL